jgi:hypothetical protein
MLAEELAMYDIPTMRWLQLQAMGLGGKFQLF